MPPENAAEAIANYTENVRPDPYKDRNSIEFKFRSRRFVLEPLAELAADWRDPVTGLTVRQLLARLRAATPIGRGTGRT